MPVMQRKIIASILMITLTWLMLGCNMRKGSQEPEELFSADNLRLMQEYKNGTIIVGYTREHEINYRTSISRIMKEQYSVNIVFLEYRSFATLEEALKSGEIDILINLGEIVKDDEYEWISYEIIPSRYFITNINNPLGNIHNLTQSKIGFFEGTPIYDDFLESVWTDDCNIKFFSSKEAAYDALERQEIDVYVTRVDRTRVDLIPREGLQIEYQFQSEIANLQFAAIEEEIMELLRALEEIMKSPRAEEVREMLSEARDQTVLEYTRAYLKEKYQGVIDSYDTIEVGFHDKNFPYSYRTADGEQRGIYVELLDFFEEATGIKYKVSDGGVAGIEGLFEKLARNDIQLIAGASHIPEVTGIDIVGENRQVLDRIISITRLGDDQLTKRAVSTMRYGIETSQTAAGEMMGLTSLPPENIVVYPDYDMAVGGLISGEIDVLIGRESVLAYYQSVMRNAMIVQSNLFSRLAVHNVLGNHDNLDLNEMMEEVKRIYLVENQDAQLIKWNNQAMNYQSAYVSLLKQRQIVMGTIGGIVVVLIVLISAMREKNHRMLKKAAKMDRLTGLCSREAYEERCEELMKRNPKALGAFCFMDLDNLKTMNDTYGHNTGDAMLIKFAEFLKTFANKDTVAFRIAGDEFGVFRVGITDEGEIPELIAEMKKEISFPVEGTGEMLPIKFSGGVSIYNKHSTELSVLKHRADIAMYRAKSKKTEREYSDVVIYDEGKDRAE